MIEPALTPQISRGQKRSDLMQHMFGIKKCGPLIFNDRDQAVSILDPIGAESFGLADVEVLLQQGNRGNFLQPKRAPERRRPARRREPARLVAIRDQLTTLIGINRMWLNNADLALIVVTHCSTALFLNRLRENLEYVGDHYPRHLDNKLGYQSIWHRARGPSISTG